MPNETRYYNDKGEATEAAFDLADTFPNLDPVTAELARLQRERDEARAELAEWRR